MFGRVMAIVYTTEFQKRGLPHMHALIWLHPDDKILDANQVDNIVSAQLPDPDEDPLLYETVTNCMLHGPCGALKPKAPCMVDNKCSKHYPKELMKPPFMANMVILNMPGQTMDVRCAKVIMTMTIDMWFHTIVIHPSSKLLFLYKKNHKLIFTA